MGSNDIAWVSSGKNHTAIINDKNGVFMIGSNLHEKLGLDLVNFHSKTRPTPLPLAQH